MVGRYHCRRGSLRRLRATREHLTYQFLYEIYVNTRCGGIWSSHQRYGRGFAAAIFRYFIPEVQCYDPLRNSIPTTIDEDFVDVDLVWHDSRRRRRISLYDLDITVVPLSRLGDIDGSSIRARNATLWLLKRNCD